mgnify:CR=1 FL=1
MYWRRHLVDMSRHSLESIQVQEQHWWPAERLLGFEYMRTTVDAVVRVRDLLGSVESCAYGTGKSVRQAGCHRQREHRVHASSWSG